MIGVSFVSNPIEVMLVEDDPMVLEINQKYVNSIEGFQVVSAHEDGQKALEEIMSGTSADLVVLDIFMPQLDGIDTLKEIRKNNYDLDVIVVSAAKETAYIKECMRYGALDYIVKPFKFDRIKSALLNYQETYEKITKSDETLNQSDIDQILPISGEKQLHSGELPKGIQGPTLKLIIEQLKASDSPCSAQEIADASGTSRVTARRYLEYLLELGRVQVETEYRDIGRPQNLYKLIFD